MEEEIDESDRRYEAKSRLSQVDSVVDDKQYYSTRQDTNDALDKETDNKTSVRYSGTEVKEELDEELDEDYNESKYDTESSVDHEVSSSFEPESPKESLIKTRTSIFDKTTTLFGPKSSDIYSKSNNNQIAVKSAHITGPESDELEDNEPNDDDMDEIARIDKILAAKRQNGGSSVSVRSYDANITTNSAVGKYGGRYSYDDGYVDAEEEQDLETLAAAPISVSSSGKCCDHMYYHYSLFRISYTSTCSEEQSRSGHL